MTIMTPGVTKAGDGLDAISWNILGQTYVPKTLTAESLVLLACDLPARHLRAAAYPSDPGRVHLHARGPARSRARRREDFAAPGDLIRLPRNVPHGLFNKSDRPVKCLFWVAPTRRLYDLFWAAPQHGRRRPGRGRRALREARGRLPAAAGCRLRRLAHEGHHRRRRDRRADACSDAAPSRHRCRDLRTSRPRSARSASASTRLPHAIRELAEIGLLPALDAVGIRTRELIYMNRLGQEVWRELRGIDGGHPVPQFSIHRGHLQKATLRRGDRAARPLPR